MHKKKAIIGMVLAAALALLQVAAVSAAPLSQTGSVTCNVTDVQITTNSSGFQVVQVTCDDGSSYGLTLDSAQSLGLLTTDASGNLMVSDTAVGSTVDITSDMLQSDPCVLPDGANQPVGEALTSYFCSDGIDYNTLEAYHQDGMGYGVIAQACFMARLLGDPSITCQSILDTKLAQQGGSGFSITLSDGTVITNWGQLRKTAFTNGVDHSVNNLGAIMSGRADSGNTTTVTTSDNGPGNGKNHSNHAGGNGKSHGHNK